METPVAAPPVAPAPVASPAPVTTPATPAAEPSTPAPVSTPALPSSPEAPATPESPAAPAAPEAGAPVPPRPVRAEYGNDIERFLRDTYAWEEKNGEAPQEVTGDEVDTSKETPEAEAAKPEAVVGEEKKEDAVVEPPTPEALSQLFEQHPEVKALLEATPEVKGKLYAMARQNAKAAPILDVFPNIESAKFANETANEFVGLKTAFQLSDSPERMADAAQLFLEQFKVVDDKGAPVLDSAGNPQYGDDLSLFIDNIKQRDRSTRVADIKARIEANQYGSQQGKENDEQLLSAYEFIAAAEAADPSELDKPDTSQMSPEVKAYFERREAELAAEKERLGIQGKDIAKKQQSETRERYRVQFREQFGAAAGRYMANYLQQKEQAGTVIPRYLLTMKDPKSGISVFAQQAFDRLDRKLNGISSVRAQSATLEMNAINEQGLAARLKTAQENVDQFLPGVIDELLNEAGVAAAADAKQKVAEREARRGDARVEPAAGTPSSPRAMTNVQMMAKAKENVATKLRGQYIDPGKRMEMELQEKYRLEAQRA